MKRKRLLMTPESWKVTEGLGEVSVEAGGGALPDCPGEAWVGRLPGLHGPNCRLPSAPRETPTHDRSLMGEVESRGSVSLISEKSTLRLC